MRLGTEWLGGGARALTAAAAPWYEFRRHGIWGYGQWTHLHGTWWVWALRADLVIGLVLAFLLLLGLSGSFGLFSVGLGASLVAIWVLVPGLTQSVAVLALLMPAMLVAVLLWTAAERIVRQLRTNQTSD